MDEKEFKEIGHSGGRITITVVTRPDGSRAYCQGWSHCRIGGGAIFAIHAIPPGFAVGTARLGGLGSPIDPGPVPGCYMVFIASDSEQMFGRYCPACNAYWRSQAPSHFCAYCALRGDGHNFLTQAQTIYLQQYMAVLMSAMDSPEDGEHIIDLDAVADAVGVVEKPPFYYSEESQQNKFICRECDNKVDILGTFCYCSLCGTRNDLQELETKLMPAIRQRINAGGVYEACVRDAVAAFDSFVGQYVKELVRRIPMTQARRNRLQNGRFHNLAAVESDLRNTFDIKIFDGINREDEAFTVLMFHRRHVYEHQGGEADAQYIDQSGDTSVRLKQALRETQESSHRIVGLVMRMAKNLHEGFHGILPADDKYIRTNKKSTPRVLGAAMPAGSVSESGTF